MGTTQQSTKYNDTIKNQNKTTINMNFQHFYWSVLSPIQQILPIPTHHPTHPSFDICPPSWLTQWRRKYKQMNNLFFPASKLCLFYIQPTSSFSCQNSDFFWVHLHPSVSSSLINSCLYFRDTIQQTKSTICNTKSVSNLMVLFKQINKCSIILPIFPSINQIWCTMCCSMPFIFCVVLIPIHLIWAIAWSILFWLWMKCSSV